MIYVDLDFMIYGKFYFFFIFIDFHFQDHFLWDRSKRNLKDIKPFAIELVRDKITKNGLAYVDGIKSCTYTFLDGNIIF